VRILELIEDLPDPRMQGKVQGAIVFVTMCGILSGCESWVDIADYCEAKLEWLSLFDQWCSVGIDLQGFLYNDRPRSP